MGFLDELLWKELERKAAEEDHGLLPQRQSGPDYISSVRAVCEFAVGRSKTIRDTFPCYTLHDETHICNVLDLMAKLLGDRITALSRDEAAMLVLAACCHDIGMSYTLREKETVLADKERLERFLETRPGAYIKVHDAGRVPEEVAEDYFRSIHHERVRDVLEQFGQEGKQGGWPAALRGRVDLDDLVKVCQSHGQAVETISVFDATPMTDWRMCAVLLRLADILDFDQTRAPLVLYDYANLEWRDDKSTQEWQKHLNSDGFRFDAVERDYPYLLPCSAYCSSSETGQVLQEFLDWVDQELDQCGALLRRYSGKWQNLVLPEKVERNIKESGYVSGNYQLTLDQDKVLQLLVGDDLYGDPSVFVRELLQNAIDAVRTREQLDRLRPSDWKPQINIRTWMDEEGCHWFRIEDNGTGMTQDTINKYFLKIGRSYYESDDFKKEKRQCGADPDYTPISRFGIGILSCFMAGDQIEVSTKHFYDRKSANPSLRLRMKGLSGRYFLASKNEGHHPGGMRGVTEAEKREYLQEPGTVIAVRTNLYQYGSYKGFLEIVSSFLVFPPVPVHYEGPDGTYDFPCEREFMDAMHWLCPSDDLDAAWSQELTMTEEQLLDLKMKIPELKFIKLPKVTVGCLAYDQFTDSPYLAGGYLYADVSGEAKNIELEFWEESMWLWSSISVDIKNQTEIWLQFTFGAMEDELGEELTFDQIALDDLKHCMRESKEQLHKLMHDPINCALLDVINKGQMGQTGWIDEIRKTYTVTNEDVIARVCNIQAALAEIRESETAVRQYQKFTNYYSYLIGDLANASWYRDYFQHVINNTGVELYAYDGIVFGNCERHRPIYSSTIASILLFRNKLRPELDLSRKQVTDLPIEAENEIALLMKRLGGIKKFNIVASEYERASDLEQRTQKTWCGYLLEHPEVIKYLSTYIKDREVTLDELQTALQKEKRVQVKKWVGMHGRIIKRPPESYINEDHYSFDYLTVAAILMRFAVRIDLKESNVYVLAEKADVEVDGFPLSFFMEPLKKEDRCLTIEQSIIRIAYNIRHPFSQWLIQHRALLEEKVPGILNELLRVMRLDEGEELITDINELLGRLRTIPAAQAIRVPDGIFLSEKDIYWENEEEETTEPLPGE